LPFILLFCVNIKLSAQSDANTPPEKFGSYTPSQGFRLATTDKGTLNFRIFTYLRYLNQLGIDSTYTDAFGNTSYIDRRQDMQVNKVNIQFNGWLLSPKFRYLFYVWTNNTALGLGAQVVVAGNLQYQLNEHFNFGAGIGSLPGVRSTEGNFPFWLTVDNRLVADEFFRPSYTTGIWVNGSVVKRVNYNLMLGNNLSQLGVDAGQLDAGLNTFSGALIWLPTTGEYGFRDNDMGDFENHDKIATRVAVHYSQSNEDYQGVPETEAFENVTIRLSDGSPIFKANLFGPGTQIYNARYNMACADAGVKYKGFSLEGEFYYRRINHLTGKGIDSLSHIELKDNGFQLQASAMVIKKTVQLYGTFSKVFGQYGDPQDARVGVSWYPWKNYVVKWNFEYMQLTNMPVGGLSLPYAVGSNGGIFHSNFQVNF
jgi:hypothetical protein